MISGVRFLCLLSAQAPQPVGRDIYRVLSVATVLVVRRLRHAERVHEHCSRSKGLARRVISPQRSRYC